MKFILLVEGHTEKKGLAQFIKKWLDSRLEKKAGIVTFRFNGWSDLINNAHRKANLLLSGDKTGDIIGVISLLDLYGPIYPDDKHSAKDKYEWLKDRIENSVNHKKFRHFFAVHETEAWLLSQPDIFSHSVKTEIGKIKNPETVNSQEPPSKFLERIYIDKMGRDYIKTTDGPNLFRKLDPSVAYAKCARLAELLDCMEEMAKHAGL